MSSPLFWIELVELIAFQLLAHLKCLHNENSFLQLHIHSRLIKISILGVKTLRKEKTIFERVMNFGYFGSQKTRVNFIDNYFHEISPKIYHEG